jgi:hypothetical protein
MAELVYDKKFIMTFNSYDHLASHADHHDMYFDWMVDIVDTYNLSSVENVLSVSWWYDQTKIDCLGEDIPPWSPELEGKAIRLESLIPSSWVDSFLAKVNEVSTTVGQAPDNVEVVDYTA